MLQVLLCLSLMDLCLTWVLAEGDLCLVQDGEPQCCIVLAPEPTVSANFAALELQRHVRMITDATLPIRHLGEAVTGTPIFVGDSDAAARIGARGAELADQEYVIRRSAEGLLLLGKDDAPEAGDDRAGRPLWVEGKFGKALRFEGTGHGIAPVDPGFDDAAGSLECWVRFDENVQPHEGTILRLDGGGTWTYHILRRIEGTRKIGYFTYDGEHVRGIVSADLDTNWHHILCTHDAAEGLTRMFVDGAEAGTATFGLSTCKGSQLHIGALGRDGGAGNVLVGEIDEVRVSNVVRDPKRDALGGPYVEDEHTTLLVHLDEGKGLPSTGGAYPGSAQLPPLFGNNGTLYAAYDFLERCCGVRWYAPTDLGTVCPTTRTLTVAVPDVRRRPAMRYRWITGGPLYFPTNQDVAPARDVALWKLRIRLGGEAYWACHSFGSYYDRFLKDHPDWFAQGYPGRPPQPCFSNPELLQQVITDARDYFDGKGSGGMGNYFGVVPEDNNSYCRCSLCLAEVDHRDDGNEQFSRGLDSNYVWGFVNSVAAEVGKTHPDKMIGALAYATYAYYPDRVQLEPNIVAQMCLHTRNWWAPGLRDNDMKIYNDWVSKEGGKRPVYLWLYYNFPAWLHPRANFYAFPGFFVHTVIDQMRMYHESGIDGIFMEHSAEGGQSFLHDQLDMYVTLRLADDPSLDGEKMVDEFFALYYGAAAEPMRELYFAIEATYMDPSNYPPDVRGKNRHEHQTEEMAWGWLGTEERMAQFGELMAQARASAQTDLEKRRVDAFDRGIWQYMLDGRALYLKRKGGG